MTDSIDLEFINDLRRDSYNKNCLVYTNNNDIIPIMQIGIRGDEIIGQDYMASIIITIKINSIIRYDCLDIRDTFFKYYESQIKTIKDVCSSDNLKLDPTYIYKNIPLHEKLISLYISKQYSDITISELKRLWEIKLTHSCDKFLEYVDSELSTCTIELYKKELLEIKKQLEEIKQFNVLNSLQSKEDVCSYWPSIIYPAPAFVEITA